MSLSVLLYYCYCTIVRMTNIPEVVQPPLQIKGRDTIIRKDQFTSSDYYTLVYHVVGLTVMSIV